MKVYLFKLKILILFFILFSSEYNYAQDDFWEPINGLYGRTVYCFANHQNGSIFIGSAQSIFRLIDYGNDWIVVNNGLKHRSNQCFVVNAEGNIFAGFGTTWRGGQSIVQQTSETNGYELIQILVNMILGHLQLTQMEIYLLEL
ncbi:MAG: hypothetical protein QME52_07830 [Bacteroidota bacterium]|nr:hypothetical protein [Bacteroidota bacterium]